jgi:hypothetical protein
MRAISWRTAAGATLAFGIVAFIVPVVSAAGPVVVAPHPHAAKGKSATSANNAAVLATLHQVHTLLETADHDYDGHRAKASEEVKHAIHELGGSHHHNTAIHAAIHIAGAVANGGNKMKMPQAQSDAQLKQAAQLLSTLGGHVPNTHKAATHLQHAANEISTALQIK